MSRVGTLAAALVLVLAAGPGPGAAAPEAPKAPKDLGPLLQPIRERHDLPALAGAIVVGPDLAAVGVTGVRSRGSKKRVTVDDRWHLGSCTKAMTATLCALLVEEKRLAWDTTLGAAFPELAKTERTMDPAWKPVTLDQLLTHRAGVPSDLSADGLWATLWLRQGAAADQRMTLARGVLRRPPVHAPGTRYLYANAGTTLAGVMAERAAREDYEPLMQKRLFEPLGIRSAGFGAPGSPGAEDEPRGHHADGTPAEPGPHADNPPGIAPAGTAHMTIGDWGRFVSLHLEARRGRSKLLSRAAAEHLHTPPPKAEPAYACGWNVVERPWGDGAVLTHSGSNTMWYCVVWMAPRKDFAVLVCTNTAGEAAEKGCDEAAGALIQQQLQPAAPR